MEKTHVTKGFIGVIAGVFGYLAGCLNEMIVILVLFILMDYVLGIAAVFMTEGQFNSKKALLGAFKKVLYGFAIALGYLADFLIIYLLEMFGIGLPIRAMLGVVVTLYLIGTEGFSIGKNLVLVGVPVSDVLLKFFGLVKDQAGKIVYIKEEPENVQEDKKI